MFIPHREVWKSQPQVAVGVDRQFAPGLQWLYNPATGRDAAMGRGPIDGTFKAGWGPQGKSALFDGTNSLDFGTWPAIDGMAECTFFCWFRPGTQVESYCAPIAKTWNDAGAAPYGSFWIELQGGRMYAWFGYSTSGGNSSAGGDIGAYSVGSTYLVLARWSNQSSGGFNNCSVWVNGVQALDLGSGTGSLAIVTGSSPSNGLLLGGRNSTTTNGGSNRFVGDVFLAGVANVWWPIQTIRGFYSGPWRVFAP